MDNGHGHWHAQIDNINALKLGGWNGLSTL
jgi:hypothetical protein